MAADDRTLVATLARAAKSGVISLPAASRAMGAPGAAAALQLRRLVRQGWIERLRRGLYLVKPLNAAPNQPAIPEDPWVLAREVFSPCYIGGWSAAEHWELTEQIFRSTLIVTATPARKTEVCIGGHDFRVFRVPQVRLTVGVVKGWRGPVRVDVSWLERTILDGLRNPELVGGGAISRRSFARMGAQSNAISAVLDVSGKQRQAQRGKRRVSGRAPLAIQAKIIATARRHLDRLRPSRSWQPTPWKALSAGVFGSTCRHLT